MATKHYASLDQYKRHAIAERGRILEEGAMPIKGRTPSAEQEMDTAVHSPLFDNSVTASLN